MKPRPLQLLYCVVLVLFIRVGGAQGQNQSPLTDWFNLFINVILPTAIKLLLNPFSSFSMIFCLFPFVRFDDFNLPPLFMYDEVAACVDLNQEGCNATNLIAFSTTAERAHDFLYEATGPLQTQGVLWLTTQDLCSSIISFAKTTDSTDRVNTGSLFEPDDRGYSYYARVIGDQSWAFASDDPGSCYDLVNNWDLVYAVRIVQGTVSNPTKFVVDPILTVPFLNFLRLPLQTCEDFTDQPWLRFEMTLVTQRSQIEQKVFGNNTGLYGTIVESFDNGAVVWRRDSWLLQNVVPSQENAATYYQVQIINGTGGRVQPAYDAWVADVKSKRGAVYFRNFRGTA